MNNIELLDFFAGHALQAMLTSKTEDKIMNKMETLYYPKMAYFIADMMVQERENYLPIKIDVTTAKQIQ